LRVPKKAVHRAFVNGFDVGAAQATGAFAEKEDLRLLPETPFDRSLQRHVYKGKWLWM
jgi:hypothetical protein